MEQNILAAPTRVTHIHINKMPIFPLTKEPLLLLFFLCFLFLLHASWKSESLFFFYFCCRTTIVPSFLPGFFRFLYQGSNRNGSARWYLCWCFLFHALWVSWLYFTVLLRIFGFRSLSCLFCPCVLFFFSFFSFFVLLFVAFFVSVFVSIFILWCTFVCRIFDVFSLSFLYCSCFPCFLYFLSYLFFVVGFCFLNGVFTWDSLNVFGCSLIVAGVTTV